MTKPKLDEWVVVAKRSALTDNEMVGITVGDHEVAVYNIGGQIYATHNICTHALAFLTDGWLEGDVIECSLHGGRFDVKTGKGLGAPITCDLRIYPVRVVDDEIQINLSC